MASYFINLCKCRGTEVFKVGLAEVNWNCFSDCWGGLFLMKLPSTDVLYSTYEEIITAGDFFFIIF